MYLHIIWNDLLQDSESMDILKQQSSLFQTLDEHEIEEALVTIGSDFIGEAYPHSFEIISTHESVEKLRKVIEKDGTSIIYSGNGLEYKELLISIYFAVTHMASTEEVLVFLNELITKMSIVNQITAKKLQHLAGRIENGE
ncbi:hypothetical protein [Brevibacillus sp. NRS-1366]|uniref:hypothetical protein n=1 Tax=Brevibacillus sp. NRS-1366 TaxID=3233899 RepID=UPI003D19AF35